jgi:chromosome segregation ATPase
MIALSADIKFACSQCGQRMVVEKSGAGLATNCPVCDHEMTVPQFSTPPTNALWADQDSYVGESPSRLEERSFDAEEPAAERPAEMPRQEIERLRAQLKKAIEEGERIKTSATHAQAEIKSFHSDRQHLKSELSQAKQRILAVESQAAALATALEATEEENTALREQQTHDLTLSRERLAATETQLEVRERELSTVQAINAGLAESLAGVEAELATLQAEKAGLLGELATAQQLLNEAAEIEEQRVVAQQALQTEFDAAATENQRLSAAHAELRAEAEMLRHDLVQTDTGRELLDLRGRVETLTNAQTQLTGALAGKTTEVQSLASAAVGLQAELQESRRLHAEAEQLAAANSEAKLKTDNDVLRGIIARQNVDLGLHHVEVRRLRRARFGLRILYTFFAIGLLGVVFLAMSIFTNHSIQEMVAQIFR